MPTASSRRPKPSAPEAGESPDDELTESPEEQMREGSEDMPPTSKGRSGRRGRKAVKDGSCSACAAGKPCSGKKDGDTSAGPGELYNPGRKNSRMNNDALSPQEYLDACDLGIQNESKAYIRARLDTQARIDKKCGGSGIADNKKCNKGGSGGKGGLGLGHALAGAALVGGAAYAGSRIHANVQAQSEYNKHVMTKINKLRKKGSAGRAAARHMVTNIKEAVPNSAARTRRANKPKYALSSSKTDSVFAYGF